MYQGMAQEYFFGSGTDVVTVLTKVLFDLLVQTTNDIDHTTHCVHRESIDIPVQLWSREALERY